MTEYEQFQQIMSEINFKKQMEENHKINDLPPGFEDLFKGFRK